MLKSTEYRSVDSTEYVQFMLYRRIDRRPFCGNRGQQCWRPLADSKADNATGNAADSPRSSSRHVWPAFLAVRDKV